MKEIPVMVSVIKDGKVINQTEILLNANTGFALSAGLYDLRVEGDGMVTLVKRGIQVNAGQRTDVIAGPMRAGAGAHIIEYAATGMTREEMAARLGKLEAAMAELQKARQPK
ncbi:MAG: carboxypeptidase-like regulatory domain-containing protein [Acidobacteriota bacterium]